MPKFTVELGGLAVVKTSIVVEAQDEQDAISEALELQADGDCVWNYHGVNSDSIVVNTVTA